MFTENLGMVIRELLRKKNFVPLEVVIADGRVVKIDNREQAWVDGDTCLLYVVSLKGTETPLTEIVVLSQVSLIRVREELVPPTPVECPF